MDYRDKGRAKRVLAEGIQQGYAELFQVYPDAWRRSDDELKAFFTTKTTAGAQVVSKTVTTFKTLCEMGDFRDAAPELKASSDSNATLIDPVVQRDSLAEMGVAPTININVQLTLPATTDESVYDKLFAAMKKHLLS